MLASFNPHSPAAKMVGFCSQKQLTHVTKYKLSRMKEKAIKPWVTHLSDALGSYIAPQYTVYYHNSNGLRLCVPKLMCKTPLSCDMEHCRVCKGVWCQQHLDLGCYLDHTFLHHCHKASVLSLILVFKQALHKIWLKQYVEQSCPVLLVFL